jgi:hypothetical protein
MRELLIGIIIFQAIVIASLSPQIEHLYHKIPWVNSEQQPKNTLNGNENGSDIAVLGVKPGEWLLSIVTLMLWWATVRLVKEGRRTAEESIKETRRIGEAQTRAYVSIKSVSISFEDVATVRAAAPVFRWIAVNSGQSPAQNFIWNVSFRYHGHPPGNNQKWLKGQGFSIPASGEVPLWTWFPKEIAASVVLVEVKIEFWFADIFGQRWFEDAYFQGVVNKPVMLVDGLPKETGEYSVELSPIDKPSDWAAPL